MQIKKVFAFFIYGFSQIINGNLDLVGSFYFALACFSVQNECLLTLECINKAMGVLGPKCLKCCPRSGSFQLGVALVLFQKKKKKERRIVIFLV